MRPLTQIAGLTAGLVALLAAPMQARAGLIFELDGVDAHHITAARLSTNQMIVTACDRSYTIEFPAGAGAALMAWAEHDTGGPLVLSIDGSLVPSDGNDYAPPGMPRALAQLLFSYDAYAHEVACGATPGEHPERHPLVQIAGEAKLPGHMHATLLDADTRTPEAYAYRQLTERYIQPPVCIGELSLYARSDRNAPVHVEPRSWIHMLTAQWYRSTDVASESDKWVARLPYQPLKADLEHRWRAYRDAFPPLDALSSIVEAMALLRAIKHDVPAAWADLARRAPRQMVTLDSTVTSLDYPSFDPDAWRRQSRAWLDTRIETPTQANLALSLAVARDPSVSHRKIVELDDVAARDPLTSAKLQLARLLYASDPDNFVEASRALFDALSQIPHAFRLRELAITQLASRAQELRDDDRDNVLEAEDTLLDKQTAAIKADFLAHAEAACVQKSPDVSTWEDLSQDVYSEGLLQRFLGRDGQLEPRAAAAVACIHLNRGMAPQLGRQFAFRHGHYRFLKYLAAYTRDAKTRALILGYRRTLAAAMNLHDIDLDPQVQP